MKIKLTFKTPDVIWEALESLRPTFEEKVKEAGEYSPDDPMFNEEVLFLMEQQEAVLSKWLRWGEYVTIQIDTHVDTATVVRPGI